MNILELAEIVDGEINNFYYINRKIKNFSIDTRTLKRNEVFIALKGEKSDGHNYLKDIKHATCLIVSNNFESDKFPIIRVNDTLEALKKIGEYYRHHFDGQVIAITGSNGKTTTKELLGSMLNYKGKTFKTYKNNNNIIGLPLNLTKLNKHHKYAVLELGMNHRNEISELSNMCCPNIALITNIGTAHIGNLGSKKEILKAKLEIIEGMNEKILFVNGYDEYLKNVKNSIKVTFKNKKFKFENIFLNRNYVEFDLLIDRKYHIKYNIPSVEQLNNVALAIAVSLYLGVKPKHIVKALNNFRTVENRLETIVKKDMIIINDAYNANYESLISGLELLKIYDQKKICLLGDILELGSKRKKIYKEIENKLKELRNIDYILVGNNIKNIKLENALYFTNVSELIDYYKINKAYFLDKVIYVKGSNAINLMQFVSFVNAEK